jgi:hypothetical protein
LSRLRNQVGHPQKKLLRFIEMFQSFQQVCPLFLFFLYLSYFL